MLFSLSYPAQDSEYGSVMTAVAPVSNDVVDLPKGMTGELKSTYLSDAEKLYVREDSGFNVYEASNGTFVGLHTPLACRQQTARTCAPSPSFPESITARWPSPTA